MKKILISLFLFAIFQCFGFSQNFNKLTQIIEADEITNGQAAYLAASYMSIINDNATDEEAFNILKEKGYFKATASAEQKITLQTLCGLVANAADQKGGLMFTLTKKSGRYSFKEFKAKKWLPKTADPASTVSGVNAIGLLNSISGVEK